MNDRTRQILETIIKEHVKTGMPVGSSVLVDKYELGVSPATVRNEMAGLENDGYIAQPHTSAGRIPTAKAYNLCLQNLPAKKIPTKDLAVFSEIMGDRTENDFKQTAKAVAKASGNAVFWAFHRHNVYYTGLTNLLEQPEFAQANVVYEMGAIIDRLDEIVNKIFDNLSDDIKVFVGENNPFGHIFGTILGKYRSGENLGLVGILGPMRMEYEKNVALVKYLVEELDK